MRRTSQRDRDVKAALSQVLKRSVTAFATSKDYIYAGDSEGRLQVSSDGGVSWGTVYKAARELGPVQAIWVDANDPRIAVAAFGAADAVSRRRRPSRPMLPAP